MPTKVIMPQLGESVVEGTVTKWLRKEGEQIAELESLLEITTDKVDTEIPSPAGGTILKILVPEGATVRAGTTLAWIGQQGEEYPGGNGQGAVSGHAAAQPAMGAKISETGPVAHGAAVSRTQELGFISPVVARLAHEKNVDLNQVQGTGANGRITKQDVLAFLEHSKSIPTSPELQAWEIPADGDLFRPTEMVFGKKEEQPVRQALPQEQPAPAAQPTPIPPAAPASAQMQAMQAAQALPGELLPLSPVRKLIAERMVASKNTAPHVTTMMEADLNKVVAHREANLMVFERDGANLTYTAYFIAAAVAALKAYPLVNSSWTDQGIRLQQAINIGMAVSMGDEGLIVPVIKAADSLSLLGVARAVNDLAARARTHRLQPEEVKGGTFTITNHGISGSLFATPIINQPQCAILGVGAIQKRVVVINDAIAIRPMAYLSLTFDHRILDGASGDRFLAKVVETLQNWV